MKKSFEEKIDLLDAILNIVCPIIQLSCVIFVVFICENAKIDTFLVCLQLFLLVVQLFLPKLLRRFVVKKHIKKLIKKIEDRDSVNL